MTPRDALDMARQQSEHLGPHRGAVLDDALAVLEAALARLEAAEARVQELATVLLAADWLITCYADMQAGRPVRGLDEAKAGYESARAALREATNDTA